MCGHTRLAMLATVAVLHRTVDTTGQSGDKLIMDCYDGKMMWLVAARRFLVSRAANVKYAHSGITTLNSASAGL